ncbi:hypothetical protein ACIPYQ_03010 [Streptomyces sp. NPDC090045]|uniref:hypothetical protein n=1 Tax=Streptomyces sp. NPDC090045 TaxID=3365927 RepID=UPI00381DBA65
MCSAAAAAVTLSAGGAAADGELASALNNPAIGAVCFPSGQVGSGNTFNGTQNINCSQSTAQSVSNPATPADGGVTGQEVVFSDAISVAPHDFGVATATCPPGKVITGGGYQKEPQLKTIFNAPGSSSPNGTEWVVSARNDTDEPDTFVAWAVCVDSAE